MWYLWEGIAFSENVPGDPHYSGRFLVGKDKEPIGMSFAVSGMTGDFVRNARSGPLGPWPCSFVTVGWTLRENFGYAARMAKAQKSWATTDGAADITAATIADVTVHEKAHVKVWQASGKRVSQHYGNNVMSIRTKPCDTKAEAIARAEVLETRFFNDCNNEYRRISAKYYVEHNWALPKFRTNNGVIEWYIPYPDWFKDRNVDANIQLETINANVPTDN